MNSIEITLFDMKAQGISNKEAYEYYNKNNIKVVLNNGLNQLVKSALIRKIPKLRVVAHLEQLNKKISDLGYFDYCFVHFVDITKSKLIIRNKDYFKKIIPVFWGSDLLRNEKLESSSYRRLFQLSHKIVLNTENMKKTFKKVYNTEFDRKVVVIKFPLMSFEKLDQLQKTSNVEALKKDFGFPTDKFIVICGHAGYKEEQYEELIESLSKCKAEVKKKCYFVFLMTYGPSNLREYQNKIRNLIKENALDGMVMSDYMIQNEFLKLFICSDIYITTITTDAFSGVMQENLYSGAMLIYGKWLNYYELEESAIVARSIEKVKQVGNSLEEIVMNYDEIKPQLLSNRELISNISSPKSIKEMWEKKIFIG
ncbi:hypothetical protein [Peribacillus asahii]|uniref:hypothetical protein n=1 Tax=Peribacillus asahii TaxID=228899 RepID=UPI00381C3C58